jgi:hypothetical protein
MTRPILILLIAIGGLAACKKSPPPETPPIAPRTDFSAEEFGIGKTHTKNKACNREIDQLLETVRACYNEQSASRCEALQRKQSDQIARLKNSNRCQH